MIITGSIDSGQLQQAELIYRSILTELGLPDEFELELDFVDEEEITQLNKQHRQKHKPTDVLSFCYVELRKPFNKADYCADINPESDLIMLGSIVICKAKMGEFSFGQLVAHGILHLFGFDHETDADYERMSEIEQRINGDV